MAVGLYAGIPITDYSAALTWYERLLGRPPTLVPNGIVAVAVLVALGLPIYFFGGDEERRSGRFTKLGWLGFGLWCLAVVGGIGTLMASWIQSDELTGDGYATDIDPTPENIFGFPSHEFAPADIRRAEEASPEVRAYCSAAGSEEQYVGCLSHVDESDVQ